jgi:hypothetical protein
MCELLRKEITLIFSNKKERNALKGSTSTNRLIKEDSKMNQKLHLTPGHTRRPSKKNTPGRNLGLKAPDKQPRYISSNTNMRSSPVVNTLLTPKNSFKVHDISSNTSDSPSLMGMMSSTISTNSTIFTENNKQIIPNLFTESKTNGISNSRAIDYQGTFNRDQNALSISKNKTDNLLRDSLSQRRNFVNDIESRLRGLRGDKTTENFKSSTKKDVKYFNYDNELAQLKRTLHDIKDQECRFIEMLSHKSPSKLQRKFSIDHNNGVAPIKSDILFYPKDPGIESMTFDYCKENGGVPLPDNNISDELARFTHLADMENSSHVLEEKEIQLSNIRHSDAYHDQILDSKSSFGTPVLANKAFKKRKSSLKSRTQVHKPEYNSRSSMSMRSSQEKKKVRFDNHSIKYKYDVDGIIDTSEYKIRNIEPPNQSPEKALSKECKGPIKPLYKNASNIPKIKKRDNSITTNKKVKQKSSERQNLCKKFENAR